MFEVSPSFSSSKVPPASLLLFVSSGKTVSRMAERMAVFCDVADEAFLPMTKRFFPARVKATYRRFMLSTRFCTCSVS